jgi:hypothetical protein
MALPCRDCPAISVREMAVSGLRSRVAPESGILASARSSVGLDRPTQRRWLAGRMLSAGALMTGLILVGTAVLASAQTLRWSVVPSPNRAGDNYLQDVSCASTTACMAVGARFDSSKVSAYATLVESWNGTSWSVENSPNPGSSFNWLEGVSCVSPVMCTAVGYAANSSGAYRTLIESWDGTSWSVVHSPNPGPANSQNYLNGVSCTSAVACTAVGYRYNGVFKTLIESWNGTSWSVVPSPTGEPSPVPSVGCHVSRRQPAPPSATTTTTAVAAT